jgi:photosystem II stability/assembly factor-like uncharacterized protein
VNIWATQASPTATDEDGTTYNEILHPDGTRERVKVRVVKGPLPWKVGAMKILGPGMGWALASGERLLWTIDNGANWKDISPRERPAYNEDLCDIFFLDAHYGWVLFGKYDEPDPKFELYYTTDTVSTWSRVNLDLGNLATHGRIAFADKQHGWMIINTATSSAFNAGALFATSDGGRTWQSTDEEPGGRGPMLMITPQEGWIVGNGEEEDLHVTRDGAKTWQTVSLPAPKKIGPAIYPTSDVPVFEDSKRGFVVVTFSGGNGDLSAAVLFATVDGGHTWKPDRILTNLEETSQGQTIPSAVVESTWITAAVADHKPTLTEFGAGAGVRTAPFSGYFRGVGQLSFVTPKEGWIIVGDGDLQSTVDGGKTWTDITP